MRKLHSEKASGYDRPSSNTLLELSQNERLIDLVYRLLQINIEGLERTMQMVLVETNFKIKQMTKADDQRILLLMQHFDTDEIYISEGIPEVQTKLPLTHSVHPHALSKADVMSDHQFSRMESRYSDSAENNLDVSDRALSVGYTNKNLMNSNDYGYASRNEAKAINEREKIRKINEEKKIQRDILRKRKKLQDEKLKKILERQLQERKYEMNRATRDLEDLEQTVALEEGLYPKKYTAVREVKLLNLEEEEEKDLESVKLFIKKNSRFFRILFSRYTVSKSPNKIGNSMKITDFKKLLRENNVTPKMITDSQLVGLFKLVCAKLGQKNELPLEAFIELFVQLSFFLYQVDPEEIIRKSYPMQIQYLIEHFKEAAKLRGEDELYRKPRVLPLESALQKELNHYLKANPDGVAIPEGYKKVEEKFPVENYSIPCYIDLPESQRIGIELLDELLIKKFGFHILEPIITYDYETRIEPVGLEPVKQSPPTALFRDNFHIRRKIYIF